MTKSTANSKGVRFGFFFTTTLTVIIFFITGIGNLLPFQHIADDMSHLGYPPYFRLILGTWKIIGAIVVAIPRKIWVKDLAYMGMLLDLTGAAASRVAMNDGLFKEILPMIISIWVIVSWRFYRIIYFKAMSIN